MAVEAESDDEILDIDIPDEEEVCKTPTRSLFTPRPFNLLEVALIGMV